MTINRILRYLRPRDERVSAPELTYWLVVTELATIRVRESVARTLMAQMKRWRSPEWITVLDLDGSRIMLRAREVRYIAESTPRQRAAYRAWVRERAAEEEEDAGNG